MTKIEKTLKNTRSFLYKCLISIMTVFFAYGHFSVYADDSFTITFHSGNDTTFEGGSTTNAVTYDGPSNYVEKYSHTSNVDDTGLQTGNYGNSWTNANITGTDRGNTSKAHVVTIPGASEVTVDLYFNGESVSYDWVSVWAGAYPDYTAASNYSTAAGKPTTAMGAPNSTNKYGGSSLSGVTFGTYTVNGNTLNNMGHVTLTIPGDSVTFAFKSDGSGYGKGYGYYAIISGASQQILSGEYKEPEDYVSGNSIYRFSKWNTESDGSGADIDPQDVTSNMDLYAVYEEVLPIAQGTYGCPWIIRGDGSLLIGEEGQSCTLANTNTGTTNWPWASYRTQITSAKILGNVSSAINGSLHGMFYNQTKNKTIDLNGFDASNVTSFSLMFGECSSLISLDLGDNFDTRSGTSFYQMFQSCSSLETLDLGDKFDTSNGTAFGYMFYGCSSLTSLDLGNKFDTSNGTQFQSMFYRCSSLTSLDLGNKFDTSNGTQFQSMFYQCSSLTSLDLGDNFDTSSGTNFQGMFESCSSLATLDLGDEFDTSSGTDFNSMFYLCSSLTNLDLGDNFDTSSGTDFNSMFYLCSSLTNLDLGDNFDTSSGTDFNSMFYRCSSLTSLDLGDNFDTSNGTYFGPMFAYCSSLATLDLGDKFNTSSGTNFNSMFYNCTSLTSLDLGDKFDTSSGTNFQGMFESCSSLATLDLGDEFDTSSGTNFGFMFSECSGLSNLDLGDKFDTSNGTNFTSMFYNCSSLESLDLSTFNTKAATSIVNMFSQMPSLKSVILGPDFTFNGKGTITGNNRAILPTPASPSTKWTRVYDLNNMVNLKGDDQISLSATDLRDTWDGSTMAGLWIWDQIDPSSMGYGDATKQYSVDPKWTQLSDDTWEYVFEVFDDTLQYYLTEDIIPGYTSDIDPETGYIIIQDKTGEITNTTTTQLGSLTVRKTVTGINTDEKFDITVTLSGLGIPSDGTKIIDGVVFTNGVAHIQLADGESKTFNNIPEGVTYSIQEEILPPEYETTYTNQSGSVVKEGVTAIVNNDYTDLAPSPDPDSADVVLRKSVTGDHGDLSTASYRILASLSGLTPGRIYIATPEKSEPEHVNEDFTGMIRYAVSVYGIGQDHDQNGNLMGLTFGPATGADYTNSYKSHTPTGITTSAHEHRCIHDDSWDEIIYWNDIDPNVYEQCVSEGCTKSVPLDLSSEIRNTATLYANYTGDGPSLLQNELATEAKRYNAVSATGAYSAAASRSTTGGWGASNMRAVLNGVDNDASDGIVTNDNVWARDTGITEDNSLLAAFPANLRDAIGYRATKYDSVHNSKTAANLKTTYDKLWLLSMNELGTNATITGSAYRHPLEALDSGLYQRLVQNNISLSTAECPFLAGYYANNITSSAAAQTGVAYTMISRSVYSATNVCGVSQQQADGAKGNLKSLYSTTTYSVAPCFSLSRSTGDESVTFTADETGSADVLLDLRKNGNYTFKYLPEGAKYKFTEMEGDYISSYEITNADANGTIANASNANTGPQQSMSTETETVDHNEKTTVTFSNKYVNLQRLRITKSVTGDEDDTSKFAFTVEFNGMEENSSFSSSIGRVLADDEGYATKEFYLSAGETVEFIDIPDGVTYRFVEAPSLYTAAYEIIDESELYATPRIVRGSAANASADTELSTENETVDPGEDVIVRFTNSKQTGSLSIRKTGSSYVPDEAYFPVEITLTGTRFGISGTFECTGTLADSVIFDKNGKGIVSIKKGDTVQISGLPVGATYSIREITDGEYAPQYTNETGTISNSTPLCTIHNTLASSDLIVSKAVTGNMASKNKKFTFELSLAPEAAQEKDVELAYQKYEFRSQEIELSEDIDSISYTPTYGTQINFSSSTSTYGPVQLIWRDKMKRNWYTTSVGANANGNIRVYSDEVYVLYRSYGAYTGLDITNATVTGPAYTQTGGNIVGDQSLSARQAVEKYVAQMDSSHYYTGASFDDFVDGTNGYHNSVAGLDYQSNPVMQLVKFEMDIPETPVVSAGITADERRNAVGYQVVLGDDCVASNGNAFIIWKNINTGQWQMTSGMTAGKVFKLPANEFYLCFKDQSYDSMACGQTGISVKSITPIMSDTGGWTAASSTFESSIATFSDLYYNSTLSSSLRAIADYEDIEDGKHGVTASNNDGNGHIYSFDMKFETAIVEAEDWYPTTEETATFDSNGKITFELAHNERVVIKDLPTGVSYTIVETNATPDGYIVSGTGLSGTILENVSANNASALNIKNMLIPTSGHTPVAAGGLVTLLGAVGVLLMMLKKKQKKQEV